MSTPAYISHDGLERLKQELHELKTVKRRDVASRIEKAKELGDISENAEYADAKDEMSFLEGRIMELEDYIYRAVIIQHKDVSKVHVGGTVTLKSKTGEKVYTIVGANEANPLEGRISNETPLAQALLGKEKGDEVSITVPAGVITYKITNIE